MPQTIKVKLLEWRKVTLEDPLLNEGDNRKLEKVKIWVDKQDYDVSENWKYGETLTNRVNVNYSTDQYSDKEWEVAVEKGFFTSNLVLVKNEGNKSVILERPIIGFVGYRKGAITGWVVGIGLTIAGIIGFVKHRKNKK